MIKNILTGILFWGGIGAGLFLIRPKAALHRTAVAEIRGKHRIWIVLTVAVLICVMLFCSMLSPMWNGSMVDYMDEYERITESFLNHRLDFDMEPDPKLLAMENPYDPQARIDNEVPFRWDSAFYQGKYYMYFGVVPVLLLFLPYRLITGTALAGYAATWVFLMIAIAGIYQLFYRFTLRFHKNFPLVLYLLGSFTFSLMSIWYCIDCPQLYCTAISSAIAMEV